MQPKKTLKTKEKSQLNVEKPFLLSRSNLEQFLNCPRCFYLKVKLGIKIPDNASYMLNHAVDKLLKREFNHYRLFALKHPIMKEYSLDAIPFFHEKMSEWQDTVNGGITFHHHATNFIVKGAIDDLWVNSLKEVIVVDYKATAVKGSNGPAGKWLKSCQRQLDVYAWLLQHNQFKVHDVGYFLYCNGNTSQKRFDVTLNFNVSLIAHQIDTQWVDGALLKARACLDNDKIPAFTKKCQICDFLQTINHQE